MANVPNTFAGMFEIYEQPLPTRLYAIHKTQASPASDPTCRLCGTLPESMGHVLSVCPALAQTKYLARHDAVLKVLFFDIIEDLRLIEESPPWYSPTKPQLVYEGAHAQAYWDVPVYGEYQDLRAGNPNFLQLLLSNTSLFSVLFTADFGFPFF